MTLAAGAVTLAASDFKEKATAVAAWEDVLRDLRGRLLKVQFNNREAPLEAYAMSVARLSAGPKSVLSTLCLFPSARRAPVTMVHAIWQDQTSRKWLAQQRTPRAIWKRIRTVSLHAAVQDLPAAEAAFEHALQTLKHAGIVDLHRNGRDSEGAFPTCTPADILSG